KPATEIAARCAKRQHTRSRQEMIQRLFFNGIDTKPAAASISGQHHLIADPLPNETESALSFVELAKPRTEAALNASIRQHRPPAPGIIRFPQLCDHCRQYRLRDPGIQQLKAAANGSDYSGSVNDTISFAAR